MIKFMLYGENIGVYKKISGDFTLFTVTRRNALVSHDLFNKRY